MVRLLGTGREGYRTNRPPSSCATLVAWPRNHGLLTPPVPIYIRPRSSVSHRCFLLPPLRPGSRTPRYQPVVYPSYSALSPLACPTINTTHRALSLMGTLFHPRRTPTMIDESPTRTIFCANFGSSRIWISIDQLIETR